MLEVWEKQTPRSVQWMFKKCKACGKLGHFAKVCLSSRREHGGSKMVGNMQVQENEEDENGTFVNEIGHTQVYPKINIIKLIITLRKQANGVPSHTPEKYLKFNVSLNPWKTFNDKIIVRVDTGADVNSMNETTFYALFPEVVLSWCPLQIQNLGNSAADVQILREFQLFLMSKGVKYLHTFSVTNANDCPNLLSHAAIFRMVVLEPRYPQHMLVEGENVPYFIAKSHCQNESHLPGK